MNYCTCTTDLNVVLPRECQYAVSGCHLCSPAIQPGRTHGVFISQVPEPEPERPETENKHFARVMLLSMAKQEEPEQTDDKKPTPKAHLTKRVKFLVAKKASGGLMAIGGAWSATKDGGDPHNDKALIKAAMYVPVFVL